MHYSANTRSFHHLIPLAEDRGDGNQVYRRTTAPPTNLSLHCCHNMNAKGEKTKRQYRNTLLHVLNLFFKPLKCDARRQPQCAVQWSGECHRSVQVYCGTLAGLSLVNNDEPLFNQTVLGGCVLSGTIYVFTLTSYMNIQM